MIKQVIVKKGKKDVEAINALQRKHHFKYMTLLGERVFYMILCRVDIITALTILSYFADCSANIHFVALRKLALHCRGTKRRGLIYWRCHPLNSLPISEIPRPNLKTSPDFPFPSSPLSLGVYFDTSYSPFKILQRKSMGRLCATLSVTSVYAKMKRQTTVAVSTTESEFIMGCISAKLAKYLWYLLNDISSKHDLGTNQLTATALWVDKESAEKMANNGKPSGRCRHIDIQYYAV